MRKKLEINQCREKDEGAHLHFSVLFAWSEGTHFMLPS